MLCSIADEAGEHAVVVSHNECPIASRLLARNQRFYHSPTVRATINIISQKNDFGVRPTIGVDQVKRLIQHGLLAMNATDGVDFLGHSHIERQWFDLLEKPCRFQCFYCGARHGFVHVKQRNRFAPGRVPALYLRLRGSSTFRD